MGILINKLKEISENDNPNASIANFLLNEEDLLNLKIARLCEKCFVSIAAPTRLAKQLGFSGYSELKYKLHDEIVGVLKNKNLEVSEYQDKLNESLSSSILNIDEQVTIDIAKAIYKARKINIFAIGGTNIVAQDIAYKFERLGKWVTSYSDYHQQIVHAKSSDSQTVCIGISYSGQTSEIEKCIEISKNLGAITVLITGSKKNFDYVDKKICIRCNEDIYRNYSTISRLVLLSICDLIYLKYVKLDTENINEVLERTEYRKYD